MRQVFYVLLLTSAALPSMGCKGGGPTPHEKVVQGVIANLTSATGAVNGVTDAASAARAVQVLNDERAKLPSPQEVEKLGKLPAAAKDKGKQLFKDMDSKWQAFVQARKAMVGRLEAGQLPPGTEAQMKEPISSYQLSVLDVLAKLMPLLE
jgi:hypothetical protein